MMDTFQLIQISDVIRKLVRSLSSWLLYGDRWFNLDGEGGMERCKGLVASRGEEELVVGFLLQFYSLFKMDYSQKVVNQAHKTRGYLQKKSTGLISIWQKRYFIILDSTLSYYADETLTELKKSISITEINTIKVVEDTEFHLVTKKRIYQLKADDESTRDLWVASLNILITQLQNPQQDRSKTPYSSEKKYFSPSPPPKIKKIESQYSPSLIWKTSRTQQKRVKLQTEFSPEIFFIQIGLGRIAKEWRLDRIRNKIILLKTLKACFFIISCKTLLYSHEDEDFLPQELILPYQFNSLYWYEFGRQQNPGVRLISKCSQITSVQVKEKKILILVGEKAYPIDLNYKKSQISEVLSLEKKIEHSIEIAKEYHNSLGLKIIRNIDRMLHLYDNKEITIAELAKRQFQLCQVENKDANGKISFRKTLQCLKKSVKEIINCCDVQAKSRVDFKEKFVKEFHHLAMNYVHKTWGNLQKALTLTEQKKIILVLYDFWKAVKDIVKDSKMFQGSISMHKKLMEKYQEELISKIDSCFSLKEEEILDELNIKLKGQTDIIEEMDTNFYSNSIYRQLHIDIRLVLFQFPEMPVNEKILQQYLTLFRNVFKHIAEQTFKFIDKWKNTNLILGTCNEIEFIKNSLFQQMESKLTEDYKSMFPFIHNKYIKEIESEITNTEILLVKNLFVNTFSTIDRNILSKAFDELNINSICQEILQKLSKFERMNKYVKRNIFESSFEEICYFYYTNIIKFNRKDNQRSAEFFSKKIAEDVKTIGQHFQKYLHRQKIYAHLKDLSLLKEFIQCDISQIKKICQSLKKQFGNSFTEQALLNLLNMRDMCEQVRDNLATQFNEFVKNSADSGEQISIVSSNRESFLENWNNARSRKSTLTVSINEFYQNQHTIHQNKYSCSVWKQGYLVKKKIMKNNASAQTKAFFKIEQTKIFEYQNETCQQQSNYYELLDVRRCAMHPDKHYIFFVEFMDYKLQFKAETSDEAKEWVKNIYEEVGTMNTLKQFPLEKQRTFELTQTDTQKEQKDVSTMQSYKLFKEKSPERGVDSPMLKKKKISSDKQKEPLSPERIVRVPKEDKGKKQIAEDSCYKCSKGFFF